MNEINTQLKMLEGLFTSVGQDNMNERESDYMEMFTAVRILYISSYVVFIAILIIYVLMFVIFGVVHHLFSNCLACYVCMVTKRIGEGRCSTNIRIIRFQ